MNSSTVPVTELIELLQSSSNDSLEKQGMRSKLVCQIIDSFETKTAIPNGVIGFLINWTVNKPTAFFFDNNNDIYFFKWCLTRVLVHLSEAHETDQVFKDLTDLLINILNVYKYYKISTFHNIIIEIVKILEEITEIKGKSFIQSIYNPENFNMFELSLVWPRVEISIEYNLLIRHILFKIIDRFDEDIKYSSIDINLIKTLLIKNFQYGNYKLKSISALIICNLLSNDCFDKDTYDDILPYIFINIIHMSVNQNAYIFFIEVFDVIKTIILNSTSIQLLRNCISYLSKFENFDKLPNKVIDLIFDLFTTHIFLDNQVLKTSNLQSYYELILSKIIQTRPITEWPIILSKFLINADSEEQSNLQIFGYKCKVIKNLNYILDSSISNQNLEHIFSHLNLLLKCEYKIEDNIELLGKIQSYIKNCSNVFYNKHFLAIIGCLITWNIDINFCLAIASIPFLSDHFSTKDFASNNYKDMMTSFEKSLSVEYIVNFKCDSIQLLSFIQVSPIWISTIFDSCLNENDVNIKKTAISCLPTFLSFQQNKCSKLKEFLNSIIIDEKCLISISFLEVLPFIPCSISKNLISNLEFDLNANISNSKKCAICSADVTAECSEMINSSTELNLLNILWKCCLDLFKIILKDEHIRIWVKSVYSLCNHTSFNKSNGNINEILKHLIKLLISQNESLAYLVACCLLKVKQTVWKNAFMREICFVLNAEKLADFQTAFLIGILGKIGESCEDLENSVVLQLVKMIMLEQASPYIVGVTSRILIEISSTNKRRPKKVLYKSYMIIGEFILQHVTKSPDPILELDRLSLSFSALSSVFQCPFLKKMLNYLVPRLVAMSSELSIKLIEKLAQLHNNDNPQRLVADHLPVIFSYLICNCQHDEINDSLEVIRRLTSIELSQLVEAQLHVIYMELFSKLSINKNKILDGLRLHVFVYDDQVSNFTKFEHKLQSRLLGFLVYFDNTMKNIYIPIDQKIEIIESLGELLQIVGRQGIMPIRMRIITTLKLANSLEENHIRLWNIFLRCLDADAIGPLLSSVVSYLLEFVSKQQIQIVPILKYLIIDHEKDVTDYLKYLFFIPNNIPELKDVEKIIEKYRIQSTCSNTNKDIVSDELYVLAESIANENVSVRMHSLRRLKVVLKHNEKLIIEEIALLDKGTDVLSKLVNTLIECCIDADTETRILLAECFGQLCAVDPVRLQLQNSSYRRDWCCSSVLDSPKFGADLLTELGKSFLRAPSRNFQDNVAYAIQEVLKIFDVKESNLKSNNVWKRLKSDIQEILMPMLDSLYMLNKGDDVPKQSPIFNQIDDFQKWLSDFVLLLSSKCQNESKKILDSCRGIIKYDRQMALYLLPFASIHAVLDDPLENWQFIVVEIHTILNVLVDNYKPTSEILCLGGQTIFSLLDNFNDFLHRSNAPSEDVSKIQRLLKLIANDLISWAATSTLAYCRAIKHLFIECWEKCPINAPKLDRLESLYLALNEPDGVRGVVEMRTHNLSAKYQVAAYESRGDLSSALICYDQALRSCSELDRRKFLTGSLQCRMLLGDIKNIWDRNYDLLDKEDADCLNSFRLEAAWKLNDWSNLEKELLATSSKGGDFDWKISQSKILLATNQQKHDELKRELNFARSSLMAPLCAASLESGSYRRFYETLVKLHILTEIEDFNESLDLDNLEFIIDRWNSRLNNVQTMVQTHEPIIWNRLALLNIARKIDENKESFTSNAIADCRLQMAKTAIECNQLEIAQSWLLTDTIRAEDCLEYAKWLREKGRNADARHHLEKSIEYLYPAEKLKSFIKNAKEEERVKYANILLLLNLYKEEDAILESNAILKNYKEASDINDNMEDVYVAMATYYDKVYHSCEGKHEAKRQYEFINRILLNLGRAMERGAKNIYRTMPRFLTIWLDFAANDMTQSEYPKMLKSVVSDFRRNIAPYQFMTAFSQLVSRICHSNQETYDELSTIIVSVLVAYPNQATWLIIAVSKSTYDERKNRCMEIFNRVKKERPDLEKLFSDLSIFQERLIELCNRRATQQKLNISKDFKSLKRFLSGNISEILIPIQKQLTVHLSNHHPFPYKPVYVKSLEENVEVLHSLQQPKKIVILGTDGEKYPMLAKPKDDLRKDARLMEFNGLINAMLQQDAEARRRRLRIRTYAVTPLNEECGLLEWVINTHAFRCILLKIYKNRKCYVSGTKLKEMQAKPNASLEMKLRVFNEQLLPAHPNLFHEWFLTTFADPSAWYDAHLFYCRSVATMSLVGYVLGLGDRHGENVLLDDRTGEVVHVDFSCLFNKGESFDIPERVPFRLTHNMVGAMGPLATRGIFHRTAVQTLQLMMKQRETLMSVLSPFVYDPLVEWKSSSTTASSRRKNVIINTASTRTTTTNNKLITSEFKNDEAQSSIMKIQLRLEGYCNPKQVKIKGLPLGADGHVDMLINKATDPINLCQMYMGWAPYM